MYYILMDVLNNQHGIIKIFYKGVLGSLRRRMLINKHTNAADDIARNLFTMLSATLSVAFFLLNLPTALSRHNNIKLMWANANFVALTLEYFAICLTRHQRITKTYFK